MPAVAELPQSPVNDHAKIERAASLAKSDLLFYTRLFDRNYICSRVHRFLAGLLMDVEAGRKKRVIINVHPRVGKSRLTTVELPTWMLARRPSRKIMLASYSGDLATKHSREARDRMASAQYQQFFPRCELNRRDMKADDWKTTSGGSYKAVGIGGGITGHGGDLLIVDDPLKDHEEAHSETMRQKVWDWFLSTAYTRLTKDGAIVIIMTRWHIDDLVGRLEDPKWRAQMKDAGLPDDEKWEKFNLEAIAAKNDPMGREPGEALYPEQFPAQRLKAIQVTLGAYLFGALYNGNPVPPGGRYCDPEKMIVVPRDQVPKGLRWVRYWDLGAVDTKGADWSAGIRAAFDDHGNLYLADLLWGQWLWPQTRTVIKNTGELEKIMVGVEAVSGFKTAFANLKEVMPATIMLKEFDCDKDKLTRALPWLALVDNRKVFLVAGDWIVPFKAQVAAFPAGANDDAVDAVSGAYIMLTTKMPTIVQTKLGGT